MKTINLEEILSIACDKRYLGEKTHKEVLRAMREACNQCFDLADEESLKVKDDVYDSSVILNLKKQIISTYNG